MPIVRVLLRILNFNIKYNLADNRKEVSQRRWKLGISQVTICRQLSKMNISCYKREKMPKNMSPLRISEPLIMASGNAVGQFVYRDNRDSEGEPSEFIEPALVAEVEQVLRFLVYGYVVEGGLKV